VVVPSGGNGSFTVSGSHTYPQEGRYQPAVSVTETNGNTGAGFSLAHVARVGLAPTDLYTVASTFSHSGEYYGQFIISCYQKYLGRNPGPTEVAGWIPLMQGPQGWTDEVVEANFIISHEYMDILHGGLVAGWITGIYQDLVNRTPAQQEVNGWLQAIQNGLTPLDVAYGFTSSLERERIRIITDYQKYEHRPTPPAQSEVDGWVNALKGGLRNEDVVAGFVGGAPGSREYFQTHYNNIYDWLFSAYQDILGRPPDSSGLQSWLQFLENSPADPAV
jgi:hypothetical protein